MSRARRDPNSPEVADDVLQRIRSMTREEWLREVSWYPEGVEETWRMQGSDSMQGGDGADPVCSGTTEAEQKPLLAAKPARDR